MKEFLFLFVDFASARLDHRLAIEHIDEDLFVKIDLAEAIRIIRYLKWLLIIF